MTKKTQPNKIGNHEKLSFSASRKINETYDDLCTRQKKSKKPDFHVPTAALKSIDSLIKFDQPKCRLKDSDFDMTIREQLSEHQCSCCSRVITSVYYQSQKEGDVLLCLDCFNEGRFVVGHSSIDFLKVDSMNNYGDVDVDGWSDQETLLLLEGMQLHNENLNKIAEDVGSKSKAQCIVHFVLLPIDGALLENIDVPTTSELQKSIDGDDFENKFPFANCENPGMNLVAFLASTLGPRVAAACAHASLGSLCRDEDKEGSPHGNLSNSSNQGSGSQNDGGKVVTTLSTEKVKAAAKDGVAAAAVKAKLFAEHEEREILRLSANIVNHQLKKLELKLMQFPEIEMLLMRECQRIASKRAHMTSGQFGPMGPPSLGTVNSRPQVLGSQYPISRFGNSSQTIHPNMSLMQQQGMYSRPSFSGMQPSSSSNYILASNSQPSLGHSMLRPVTGPNSGLG